MNIKAENEVYAFVSMIPNVYSSVNKICAQYLTHFLENNPQLENLILRSLWDTMKNKEIAKAIFSLQNLKKLNVEMRYPLKDYLGSKKIERLVLHEPFSNADRNWKYLENFPFLCYLEIKYN